MLGGAVQAFVLLPYEITLFSNSGAGMTARVFVLLPYEITLFSNVSAIV